ncbi:MAG: terminase [Verrucomicrobia bacterium]|nr:terminase [Verrucomicrobiota bacterium]
MLLEGGYQTGKTYAALSKLHALLCKYPNCHALMVRQTRNSLLGSAVVTYEKKILPSPPSSSGPIVKYGGERPEFYIYPNGSKLIVGGLDDADKYLSAEYDYIYVNQAEEITLDSWEKLCGRATGRAGNAPYAQVIADCNPGPPHHWLLKRQSIRRYRTELRDNPTLYNHETGEWTEAGKLAIERLQSLTGLRYKRGFQGLWAGAEGQIYDFDDLTHYIDPFPIPKAWRKIRVVDFGYTNPFVCQWWAIDPDDRMYLYREIYHTKRTVRVHAEQINALSAGEEYEVTIADHDAEDRATLHESGIYTYPAEKAVTLGIERVQERLKLTGDGRPRLYVMRGSLVEVDLSLEESFKPTNIVGEFGGYVWQPTPDGRPNKDTPLKINDHSMDACRYAVMYCSIATTTTSDSPW